MKLRGMAVLPTAIVAVGSIGASSALAVDIVIEDGQIAGISQTLESVGDTLTVEAGGTVSTVDGAVVMDADSQVLNNRALIEAADGDAVTINGDGSTVNNDGTIQTYGYAAYGLYSTGSFTTIANEGNIFTFGECGYGVYTTAGDFVFINNGTVATFADENSYGVYAEDADDVVITNNGLIETRGTDAYGIYVYGSHAVITNNGILRTSGEDGIGVYVYSDAADSNTLVVNTGFIETMGASKKKFAQGIYINASGSRVYNSGTVVSNHGEAIKIRGTGSALINSGTVISPRSDAILMDGADQTLELLSGSVIDGHIRFTDAATATLRFGVGLDARLTIDGMPTTIITDRQILAENGDVLTVLTPGLVHGGNTVAIEANSAVSGAVRSHMSGRRLGAAGEMVPLGYAATPAANRTAEADEGYTAWARGFGAASSPRGSSEGFSTSLGGGVFGFDKRYADGSLFGAFLGFGDGVARLASGSRVDTTTIMGGAYGSFAHGSTFVDVAAGLGATTSNSSRRMNDNMAEGGIVTAYGEYSGIFVSPSITVGMDHELGNLRLTPSMTLLYAGIHQDGYSETLSELSVGSQFTHVFSVNGELELGTLRFGAGEKGWSASGKLGVEGTFIDGRKVDASLINTSYEIAGMSASEARGYVGVDVGFTKGNYDFSLVGKAGYSSEGVASASIQGGLSYKF